MSALIHTHTFAPAVSGHERIPVRSVILDGNPWFVAADVCRAIGLRGDVSAVCRRLDPDQRMTWDTPADCRGQGKAPKLVLVSESGLYKLILRAHPDANPAIRAFQDWVTRIVLPSIRKDGAYIAGEEKVATGEMDEDAFVLKAFEILKAKVERLTAERDAERARSDRLEGAFEEIAGLKGTYNLRTTAGMIGVSERQMIRTLLDKGVLWREHRLSNSPLMPAASLKKKGFFTVKLVQTGDHSYAQTRVTTTGVAWLARRFNRPVPKEIAA